MGKGLSIIMVKKTLFGVDKSGGVKEWSVWTQGDTIYVEHGRMGGKKQVKTTVCKPKNCGKSNATTSEQQAISEAQSKWNKQYDKYYRETIEEAQEILTDGVMLAQDYTKKPHFLDEEFYTSPKYDGLRVKTVRGDGLTWNSRGGKTYPIPPQIISELEDIMLFFGFDQLDGRVLSTDRNYKRFNPVSRSIMN